MPRKSPAALTAAAVLILVAMAGTLWVPIYARSAPKWGPFPFFYWYQMVWVLVIAVLSWLAYLLLRTRPGRARTPPRAFGHDQRDQRDQM